MSSHVATAESETDEADTTQRDADRSLVIACILTGTMVLSPVAIPFFVRSYRQLREAERRGTLSRPWAITVAGAFSLVEAIVAIVPWSTMLFSHDSVLMTTIWNGYGQLADGAYYIDWNSTALGGTPVVSEYTLAVGWTLFVAAPRVGASWYFLKMERVGLQWMIITSYVGVAVWVTYAVQAIMPWNQRIGASEFGIVAWVLFNLTSISGFVLLPFLHNLNKERFAN